MKKILVTGSSGLIGSEVATYFANLNWKVYGVDNNMREVFFGSNGNTRWNQLRMISNLKNFTYLELDIRDRIKVNDTIKEIRPDVIVHTAAQPSHDLAAKMPYEDFDTNAVGTFNLLEATRRFCSEASFIHMSTNKVYGDTPNYLDLVESEFRWDFANEKYLNGISENLTIDQSKHSLFGASKVAADIAVQEYGRYFSMNTVCLRGGCLTGPNHSGVELHGFLSYLIKCNLENKEYNIYGYKGKQVRDNIHSFDVANFINQYIQNPRSAVVYNLGGGKENSCSILEAFKLAENHSGIKMKFKYIDTNRDGDHICYYSDLTKIKNDYPQWTITKNLNDIFLEIIQSWKVRN
jgi:CDP-paratose 2-epimerase